MRSLHERIPQLFHLLTGEVVGKGAAKKASDVLENNQELLAFLILKAGCFQNQSSIMQCVTALAQVEVPRFTTSFEPRHPEVEVSDGLEKALGTLLAAYDSKTKVAQDAERLLRQHAIGHMDSTSSESLERWALP